MDWQPEAVKNGGKILEVYQMTLPVETKLSGHENEDRSHSVD